MHNKLVTQNWASDRWEAHLDEQMQLARLAENWSLSPAFDFTFAYHPDSVWLRQHLMSLNGKFRGITERDLMMLADQFNVPGASAIIREVREAATQWESFATEAGISPERTAEVQLRLSAVAAAPT